jgi:hypothetical protein
MVQAGQHLPLKCEALTSYPSTTNKTNQYLSWNVRKSSKTLSCRIVIQLVHFPVATFLPPYPDDDMISGRHQSVFSPESEVGTKNQRAKRSLSFSWCLEDTVLPGLLQ